VALTASQPNIEAAPPPVVEVAGVEVLPSRPRRPALVAETPPPQFIAPSPQPVAPVIAPVSPLPVAEPRILRRQEQILDMFQVFARIIAVRFLLFLSLIGAFVLALQAMEYQTIPAIAVLISYSLLTVAPLVGLELRNKLLRG
jgi:hypothetical protein